MHGLDNDVEPRNQWRRLVVSLYSFKISKDARVNLQKL